MVTSKRTRSSLRNHPTHSEAVALIQNKTQTLSQTNKSHAHEETEEKMPDEYEFAYSSGVYDSDDDITTQQTSSSTPFVSGNPATTSIPIVSGNSATATSSGPIASGNSATTSAVVSDNPQAQSAATLIANSAAACPLGQSAATLVANSIAANTADIIQIGNVIANHPPIPKRAATTHHTVFNMRHAVIVFDTVDAKLARLFFIQPRDPAFEGHWSAHIQKTALRLIKLRLMDEVYRTLVPENEIAIWPRRLTAPPEEALEFSMVAIAETIVKIYAPETAPHVKSIDQRCREAPFAYKMKDQDVEEKFIILYLQLIENHFLGETLSEEKMTIDSPKSSTRS
jgi:hypothetical protein